MLELEWVLRSSFEFGKDDVLIAMSSRFSAAELTFESERALGIALQLFRKGSAEFAGCLHVALATQAGEQPLWAVDKGAANVSGAQLLVKARGGTILYDGLLVGSRSLRPRGRCPAN